MRMALPSIPPTAGLTSWCWTLRGVAGICLYIDVSVARPLALSHVAGASLTAGYTADRAERAKLLAYGDVGHHRVVPFVLEEFGGMGPLTSASVLQGVLPAPGGLAGPGGPAGPMVGADLDVILASALVGGADSGHG
eukprot:jgi/Mesvir1/20333/Mv19924-RA.1